MKSTYSSIVLTENNRRDRGKFHAKSMSSMMCFTGFLVLACLPLVLLPVVARRQPSIHDICPAILLMTVSTLAVVIRTSKRRRAGQRPRRLSNYALFGFLTGICCVLATIATQQLVEIRTQQPATFRDEGRPAGTSEYREANSANARSLLSSSKPIGVPDSAVESSFQSTPESPKTLEPIVLAAGTRLACKAVARNIFQVRLENKFGEYRQGLRVSDFKLQTQEGVPVPFGLTELPGREIALPSNVCIVIDESLQKPTTSAQVLSTVETVLNSTAAGTYKLVSGGTIIRTHLDWTQNEQLIRSKLTRIPRTNGNAFSSAVSLSLSELRKKNEKRILVAVSDPSSPKRLNRYVNQYLKDDSVYLLLVGQNRMTSGDLLTDKFFELGDLDSLSETLNRITSKREAPGYQVTVREPNIASLRLTIGSGDSALTRTLR